jgi:hypothetical protein
MMIMQSSAREKGFGRWALAVVAVATMVGASMPEFASAEGNQVFFRGGYAGTTSDRGGELFTDAHAVTGIRNGGDSGYYIGAGLDLLMHKDFLGFKGMSLLGEVGLEYKRFSSTDAIGTGNLGVSCSVAGTLGVCNTNPKTVQITMLTVDVSPKLKFMEGSAFRPWIIPIGLDFHVISPPSNQTNYLDIGVQFGAGAEYNFWGPLNLGIDGRFHLASNQTNTVNNFGTVGTYLGILF